MKTTRAAVFHAIDGERFYQDHVVEQNPNRHDASLPEHSVGDYLTMLATYLREAQENWTRNAGVDKSLDSIRKIAGIAVHCMEDHGAPLRTVSCEDGLVQKDILVAFPVNVDSVGPGPGMKVTFTNAIAGESCSARGVRP